MTEERIPFGPAQETGWEPLAGAGAEAHNVVLDGRGALRRRPGISPYFTAGGDVVVDSRGIVGLHYTSGGRLYALADGGATRVPYRLTPELVYPITGDIIGSKRPVVAEAQTILAVAAGDRIQKIYLDSDVSEPLDGDPPPSTHIIAHAQRLVSIEITTPGLLDRINYSAPQTGTGIDGFETWNGDGGSDSGPFPLGARPDPLFALHENTNEVFGFGATTLQLLSSDPQSVFAPVNTREFGISAPYSVIKDDQNFAWLDDSRRFVHSDGRTFQIISDPLKRVLDAMPQVSDGYGFRVITGPTDALVWKFPTDGRTFTYQRGAGWGQWSGWNGLEWQPFPVTALTRAYGSNQNIVGTSDGRIGVMTHEAETDLGAPINAYVTTGFLDHGTAALKQCDMVHVRLRRTDSRVAGDPAILLEWRDDLGPWRGPLAYDLGDAGQDDVVLKSYGLGPYRARQWRLRFTGPSALSVASVTEFFTVQDI